MSQRILQHFAVLICAVMTGCGGSDTDPVVTPHEGEQQAENGETANLALDQAQACIESGEFQQAISHCNTILDQWPDHHEALLRRAQGSVGLKQLDAARRDVAAAERLGADPKETTVLHARIAVAAGEFLKADQTFTKAIQQSPEDAELYQERALVRAVLEQHEAAIADFGEGVRRNPRDASLYRWRAEEYFQIGKFDDALQDVKNAILLEPNNPEFYLARAHFRAELGRVDEALADYQQAIELDDSPFTYYLRGNLQAAVDAPDAALADLTAAITKEPGRSEYYLARANVQISLGSPDLALADYDRATELEPDNANAFQRRAGFHLSQGNISAATADLTAAIEQDQGLLSALRLRGITYRMSEQYANAVADFQAAIDSEQEIDDTMRAELLYQQGITFQAEEKHEEAIQKLKQATTLNDGLGEAYFAISMSYGALLDFDEARNFLNAAIEADAESSEYLLARANLYLAEAQFQQIIEEGNPAETVKLAHADFQRAVEVNPHDDSAWYALAVVRASGGDYQEAVSQLTRAIKLNPEDDRYYQARGDIHLKRQQYGASIDDFTKALELNPDSQELYESRGYAYGELGKKDEALSDYGKADSLTATNPETPDEANAINGN